MNGFIRRLVLPALALTAATALYAQTAPGSSISLGASLDSSAVPLNRTVVLTVRLSWEGSLDSVLIGEVSDPVLTNLEIAGTATANKTVGTADGASSVKEIAYTLRPKSLGMAYIDSLTVTVRDLKAGTDRAMRTPRLSVMAVAPVREKSGKPGILAGLLIAFFFLAGASAGIALWIRSRGRAAAPASEPAEKPVEERYLAALKETVALHGDGREDAYASLARLFRLYLAETAGVPALEATTRELIASLKAAGADEGLTRRCESFFGGADEVKFSGRQASQSELEEAYTVVESVFESRLVEAQLKARMEGEASSKQSERSGGPVRRFLRRIF
jgi:hypothetical protein